jgi:NAD(P)-dependent dehydrogenase (short-subunit alcohol dehydrogenase family)/acyl carrier protein
VQKTVLAIVADQTGYPPDMLDLDLDLEADLGVDTVKQAETFAAVREAYDIPRDDNLSLRDFPTLAHVIGFVRDRRPDLGAAAPASTAEASPAPAAAAPSDDDVQQKVLALVAEQTGYPPDMLDLELDLEADLGVDTVKQAEMFAAVREAYDIPRDDDLSLRDFPTLNHVIQFVHDRRPKSATPAAQPVAEAPVARPLSDTNAGGTLRRVPVAVLRPPLDTCKPTAVTLDRGRRVIVMMDEGGVGRALTQRLEKRGVTVLAVDDRPDADAFTKRIEGFIADGPIHGVYWLPALDPAGDIAELDVQSWHAAIHARVKLLYATMRALYEEIGAPHTFLVSATRLGGRHGFDDAGAVAPLGGAVTGFTKTFKREKPLALVKAVDFEASRKTAAFADLLLAETLSDPGAVEIGYVGETRHTVTVVEQDAPTARNELALDADSVFVVTGAAGSIVSAIVEDLAAAAGGGTFHLLDLTPQPDPEDADLVRFASDREGLKRELFERIKASGERATPAAVEKQLAGLERSQAALRSIATVEAAGGRACYHQLNLLDGDAVNEVIQKVRNEHGRIDVLLHAAGLEISHRLPDKKPSEFDLVFDVKADGWFHLLRSIGEMPIGATVVFSSIAGRFGNGGQVDYSAANDLLAKTTSSFKTSRPATRGITIDWTAWANIGMASRGSIPKMMELAGIDMLPPEAGIPIVRRELVSGTRGEVVVGGRLGALLEELDETGGLDVGAVEHALHGPMNANIVRMGIYCGLEVETPLDPKEQPFLYDHRIDGTPVLPGVMGIEAFSEVARMLFPEWHVDAVENVEFMAPFKFYREQPRTLLLQAHFVPEGDELVARCRLIGKRELKGQSEPKVTTHFAASVRLSRHEPETAARDDVPREPVGTTVLGQAIYDVYFHGPAYQVLEQAWRDNGSVVGRLPERLPSNHKPEELRTVLEPRLVEACFQTAGIFQIGRTGRMGLPQHIDRVQPVKPLTDAKGRLHAVVTPRADGSSFDAYVADQEGNVYVTLTGYRTAELPAGVDPEKRKPLQSAME